MDLDEALAELVARSGDRLLRVGYQLTHDRVAAQDLVQDALSPGPRTGRLWRSSSGAPDTPGPSTSGCSTPPRRAPAWHPPRSSSPSPTRARWASPRSSPPTAPESSPPPRRGSPSSPSAPDSPSCPRTSSSLTGRSWGGQQARPGRTCYGLARAAGRSSSPTRAANREPTAPAISSAFSPRTRSPRSPTAPTRALRSPGRPSVTR